MGKSQKKRLMRRHNPMRVPDSHLPKGLASASSTSSKNEAILPILQKMEGPDAPERKWACVAVSNLIQNDPSTRRLLQGKNVVGALITRLSDSEDEVVAEATGALRNLCIDGGFDICAEMYNKNILSPLKSFIPKISTILSEYITSAKTAPESAKKTAYEFAENVITILWCLSETSNKALNAINQLALVPFLMAFLDAVEKLPIATVIAAAQCLYVLTDENAPAIVEIKSNSTYTACLRALVTPTNSETLFTPETTFNFSDERLTCLKVLVCGILRNVSTFPSSATALDLDRTVVLPWLNPVLAAISLSDASATVSELILKEAEPQLEKLSLRNTPKSDHKTPAELELERIERKLRTVQLALEILTGVCATLPEPESEPVVDDEDETIEQEGESDAIPDDVEMDIVPEKTCEANGSTVFAASNAHLHSLLRSLLSLINPTVLSFPPSAGPSSHPPTTSVLGSIHVSALECLNNIFLSLTSYHDPSLARDVESGRRIWEEVWTAMGKVGLEFGPGQERRREMWEVAVGVLWGIGNIWKGSLVPDEAQVKLLIQLYDSSQDPHIRVRCIGALECLAQNPDFVEANKVISNYLLSLLPPAASPSSATTEPLIQALSALIDIYSDENMPYDVNFRQGKYIDALSGAVDGVKRAVKSIDKRKEGGRDLRRRGEEVLENLLEFIAYRKKLIM